MNMCDALVFVGAGVVVAHVQRLEWMEPSGWWTHQGSNLGAGSLANRSSERLLQEMLDIVEGRTIDDAVARGGVL
jgi:hypothetical protein